MIQNQQSSKLMSYTSWKRMISPKVNNMKWPQMAQMAETVVGKYTPIAMATA